MLDDSYHVITVDRQRDIVIERAAAFAKRIQVSPIAKPDPDPDDLAASLACAAPRPTRAAAAARPGAIGRKLAR